MDNHTAGRDCNGARRMRAATTQPVPGQSPAAPAARAILSLTEPSQGPSVQSASATTGLVTFARTAGDGIRLAGLASATATERDACGSSPASAVQTVAIP
jgi:hypothetical protein